MAPSHGLSPERRTRHYGARESPPPACSLLGLRGCCHRSEPPPGRNPAAGEAIAVRLARRIDRSGHPVILGAEGVPGGESSIAEDSPPGPRGRRHPAVARIVLARIGEAGGRVPRAIPTRLLPRAHRARCRVAPTSPSRVAAAPLAIRLARRVQGDRGGVPIDAPVGVRELSSGTSLGRRAIADLVKDS